MLCTALPSLPASADDWIFKPFIGSSEQYTDNVFSSSSNEESDFVTSLDLGFKFGGETKRSKLDLSYNFSQDYYANNSQLDGYTQNLIGTGTVELIDNRFFIDGRVTFTEETLGSAGSTSAGERTQSSGRTQVFNGSISPYLIQNFDGWVTGIARYGHTETQFFDADVGNASSAPANQTSNEFQIKLTSGTRFTDIKWAWDNKLLSSESDANDSFSHFASTGTSELPLSRMFSLIGTFGYDSFDVTGIDDSKISGLFGGAGVRFHPNNRTDASVQVGRRFSDMVYDLNMSYAPTSQDNITASYVVSIQSASSSLADTDILDAQGNLIQPNFSLTKYVDGVTKSKIFKLGWNGSRRRNSYGISGNFIEREILSTGADEQVVAISGNYGRRLTPRADLNISAGISDVIDGQVAADETTVYNFGSGYSYTFGNGLTGSANYNYLLRDNNTSGDIAENSFSISLRKNF